MKKIITNKRFYVIILLTIIFFPVKIRAIGLVTKPIEINDALRGNSYEESTTIANTENEEITVRIFSEGEISDWIMFITDRKAEPSEEIDIKPRENIKVITKIIVPDNASNGQYSGSISVMKITGASSSMKDTVATLQQKVSRSVEITVSDKEIFDIQVSVVPKKFDLKEGEPLFLNIAYFNKGNTIVRPEARITIRQAEKVYYDARHKFPGGSEGIYPGQAYETPDIIIPLVGLKQGVFRAEIAIFIGDQIISEDAVKINLGSDTVAGGGAQDGKSFNSKFYLLSFFALLIISFFAYIYISKQKTKK